MTVPSFAKVADVEVGTVLVADDGFTCLRVDAHLHVKSDPRGFLYVDCADGQHALVGQRNGDHYVGLYTAKDLGGVPLTRRELAEEIVRMKISVT